MPIVIAGATPQRSNISTSRPGTSLRWTIALSRTATKSLRRQLLSTVPRQ
jgi:hypothetical protein